MMLKAPFDLDTVTMTAPKAYERIPVGDLGRISLQYCKRTRYYYATAYRTAEFGYEPIYEVSPTPNRYNAIASAYNALTKGA